MCDGSLVGSIGFRSHCFRVQASRAFRDFLDVDRFVLFDVSRSAICRMQVSWIWFEAQTPTRQCTGCTEACIATSDQVEEMVNTLESCEEVGSSFWGLKGVGLRERGSLLTLERFNCGLLSSLGLQARKFDLWGQRT